MELKKNKDKKRIQDIIYVLIGSIILAVAITSILKPNGIITGGITGFSLVMERILGISYTYIYYVLSLMVLIATYLTLGKREARKIVVFSLFFPMVLILFSRFSFNFVQNDLFLASVYYGIMAGADTGVFF